MQGQREVQRGRMRKLGLDAESAVLVVERREDRGDDGLVVWRRSIVDRSSFFRPCSVFSASLVQFHRVGDLVEHAGHALDRHERAAGDQRAAGGEERGRGPPAEVVALVDVGTAIGVDADGHETIVDERGDGGIGVGRPVHLVAGAAPGGGDRQEHGLAFARRAREGLGVPCQPANHGHVL
jgi:hypothetical protein